MNITSMMNDSGSVFDELMQCPDESFLFGSNDLPLERQETPDSMFFSVDDIDRIAYT